MIFVMPESRANRRLLLDNTRERKETRARSARLNTELINNQFFLDWILAGRTLSKRLPNLTLIPFHNTCIIIVGEKERERGKEREEVNILAEFYFRPSA